MHLRLPHPGFWMAVALSLIAVGLQTMLSFQFGAFEALYEEVSPGTPAGLANHPLIAAIVNTLAFSAVIGFGLYMNRVTFRQAFPWQGFGFSRVGGVCLAVGGAVVVLSEVDNLLRSILPTPDLLKRLLEELFASEDRLVWEVILVVIVAPLTEELLYRGIVLRGLLARFPVWAAVLLSSALFGAVHLNPWQFVSASAIGVLLAWVFLRSGSVWLCVLGHAVGNAAFVAATNLSIEIPGLNSNLTSHGVEFQPWWLDAAGATLLLAGIGLFRWATPSPPPLDPEPPPVIQPYNEGQTVIAILGEAPPVIR